MINSNYEKRREITDILNNISIVLVEPIKPGNIGSVARAMKNMDIRDLRLVNPLDFPHKEANIMSVHAQDILEKAQIFNTLNDAIEQCHIVFGTSARPRYLPQQFFEAQEASYNIVKHAKSNKKIAILFGREDTGLTNEELNMCNFHIGLLASHDYSSLNLSHAVQILTYLIHFRALRIFDKSQRYDDNYDNSFDEVYLKKSSSKSKNYKMQINTSSWDKPIANHKSTIMLFNKIIELMKKTGFYDSRKSKLLDHRIQRLLFRVPLDQMEVNILLGVISESLRQLQNNKNEKK